MGNPRLLLTFAPFAIVALALAGCDGEATSPVAPSATGPVGGATIRGAVSGIQAGSLDAARQASGLVGALQASRSALEILVVGSGLSTRVDDDGAFELRAVPSAPRVQLRFRSDDLDDVVSLHDVDDGDIVVLQVSVVGSSVVLEDERRQDGTERAPVDDDDDRDDDDRDDQDEDDDDQDEDDDDRDDDDDDRDDDEDDDRDDDDDDRDDDEDRDDDDEDDDDDDDAGRGGGAGTSSGALDDDECSGRLGAVRAEQIIVPARATCDLAGTIVNGDIKVEPGATLVASQVRVGGNVQADGHRRVDLGDSAVDGNVQTSQGGSVLVLGVTIGGDLQVEDSRGPSALRLNVIRGNLQAFQNHGGLEIRSNRGRREPSVQGEPSGADRR